MLRIAWAIRKRKPGKTPNGCAAGARPYLFPKTRRANSSTR
jgi:hypothetical protein